MPVNDPGIVLKVKFSFPWNEMGVANGLTCAIGREWEPLTLTYFLQCLQLHFYACEGIYTNSLIM